MSGQYGQGTPARGLKSSPSSMKQGPMKATIPMASLLKQSSNFVSPNSPNLSPTSCWKTRVSPDHSLGQRSPGSSVSKGIQIIYAWYMCMLQFIYNLSS